MKALEDHGLITKKVYPVVPPKVEHSLTEFGQTVIPVIPVLENWGDANEEQLRRVILKRLHLSDAAIEQLLKVTEGFYCRKRGVLFNH